MDQITNIPLGSSEVLPDMVCRHTAEGRLTYVNDAYCRMANCSREELLGTFFFASLPLEAREAAAKDLLERVRDPRSSRRTLDIPLPDGTVGHFEWIDSPLVDAQGNLLEFQSVGRDITDHVRTEKAFKAVLEHSVQGIAILQDGRYVFVNSKYAELTGYSIEEMLERYSSDFMSRVHPDDREIIERRHRERLQGKEVPNNYSFRRIKKDGSVHWVEIHASLVQWKGRPAIQVAMVDITERKLAELALVQSENRLRTIAETLPEQICFIDRQGRILYTNRPIDGIGENLVIGSSHLDWVAEEQRPQASAALARAIEEKTTVDYEIHGRGESGFPFWKHYRLSPVVIEGQIDHLVMTSKDITRRRLQEKEIKESRDRLELALQGADLGLWDWNIETGEHIVNKRWASMLEYDDAELAPSIETWEHLVHPEDLPQVSRILQSHLDGSTPSFEMIYRMKTRSGEWRWIVDRGKVVERASDGTPLRASGTHLDITEKREFEEKLQQTQKLESLGILAGGIAHDFNNLLMGILGNADMALLDLPRTIPGREHLEDIVCASQRAAELCNQMLAYAGKGRFNLQRINLSDLVREMAQLLEVSISKRVRIEYDIQNNLPTFEGDPSQIRQIVMNLITNASDAMEENGGGVTLTTGSRQCTKRFLQESYLSADPAEGEYVFFQVSDTGKGMNSSIIEKIFDPFFTTKFHGRGLGLAAVLGIVRSHNGTIQVESHEGKGTRFTLFFPVSESLNPSDTLPPPHRNEWRGTGVVLLVDDEPTIREIGRRILERKGFAVLLAEDGEDCVRQYLAHQMEIVAVVLDLTMPKMSGEETFHEIRSIDPNVKVILSSGYSENEATSRFVGQGLAGFIQKPYRPTLLAEKVRQVLEDSFVV